MKQTLKITILMVLMTIVTLSLASCDELLNKLPFGNETTPQDAFLEEGTTIYNILFWAQLIGIPGGILAILFVNNRLCVEGANDNLTGCYVGMAVAKAMADTDTRFENTELVVICSGSEEAGLRGAKAWCEAHAHEFNDVPTFVFSYDTITQPEYLSVN